MKTLQEHWDEWKAGFDTEPADEHDIEMTFHMGVMATITFILETRELPPDQRAEAFEKFMDEAERMAITAAAKVLKKT